MRRVVRGISLLIAGTALGGILLLPGQNKAPAGPPGTGAAGGGVNLQMIVTVEARHGKEIPVLKPEDFSAWESKERLHVSDVIPLRDKDAGLELFLLLDDASATSLGSQFGDLKQFILAQPPVTTIGIGYMHNGTFTAVQDFTTDHAHAATTLRLPLSAAGAMASPYLSLSDLIKRWPGNPERSARREVIFVTSGVDPLGGIGPINPYLENAIRDAQRAGVIVYTIYTPASGHSGHSFYLMDWGQNHLAQLAEETGGEYYMLGFGAPVAFAPYLDEIAEHLVHQYRVIFQMKPEKKADYRSVRFSTEVANADLVSADKVYVPAAAR